MTTSTNDPGTEPSPDKAGGAFADALTLLRLLATPLIMALILWQWPEPQIAILASFLFIIAALSDIFDDLFGGSARSSVRRYGYLDDAADTVLFVGVLIALGIVIARNGMMHWAWLVPVAILVLREAIVGIVKGYELSRYGWPDNPLSNAKGAFAMLGTVLMVGSPWLTQLLDRMTAGPDNALEVYGSVSPTIWILGQVCLWIAAIFSVLSGLRILQSKAPVEGPTDV
ncbi:MAG: CDP-alcohol phosphatidyltransferase family protein [Litorimonas sp.]